MSAAITDFHFLRPLWLLALLPVGILLWTLWRHHRSGEGWRGVIAPALLPHLLAGESGLRSPRKLYLLALAWLCAVLALAGPAWQQLPQPVERREDALVIVYDLSLSMLAEDIQPSRLVRSRQKLLDLLQRRREGTTALVAFAGDAHIVSPLTDDDRTIANLLPALQPDIMPVPGSDPARALALAVQLLRNAGLARGRILLLTDGVDQDDLAAIDAAVGGSGYRLAVLGIGTAQGSPIPTAGGYLQDRNGTIVIPTLSRAPLQQLAQQHGGAYSDITLDDSDLDLVLRDPLAPELETSEVSGIQVDRWHDSGFWLLLLLLPITLGAFRRGWILALVLLPLPEPATALDLPAQLLNRDQQAARLLAQGRAEEAAERFRDPAWAAAAHYRAGQYEKALQQFRRGDDADDWYNQGNALARSGELAAAIEAYRQALERDPEMEDAAFNKALLEQLMQQQQQSQQGENSDQAAAGQPQDSSPAGGESQADSRDPGQGAPESGAQSGKAPPQQPQQQSTGQPGNTDEREPGQARTADNGDAEQQQAAQSGSQGTPRDPEQTERELANEQWLRRIPDDPSGLLRRKFQYESRERAAQRKPDNEKVW